MHFHVWPHSIHSCGSAESTKTKDGVMWRNNGLYKAIKDKDGELTWPAPKNSSAVLTGGSTKMMSWPKSKRAYLYMVVLKSSWACGSGQESAHCSSSLCSALSCCALFLHSGTGWRAPCPVPISTSSKWYMTSRPDHILAQPRSGNRSSHMYIFARYSGANGGQTEYFDSSTSYFVLNTRSRKKFHYYKRFF